MPLGCRGSIYLNWPGFLELGSPGLVPWSSHPFSAYKLHVIYEVNGIAGGILKCVNRERLLKKVWIMVGKTKEAVFKRNH